MKKSRRLERERQGGGENAKAGEREDVLETIRQQVGGGGGGGDA